MSQQLIGILLGGIIPAVLLGILAICQKLSNQAGIATSWLIITAGIGVLIVGLCLHVIMPDKTISLKSALPAVGVGLCWGISMGLIGIALVNYGVPISKLVPLYNMNTLVAVVLGLLIFGEWQELNLGRLLVGSFLIIIGGSLAATA